MFDRVEFLAVLIGIIMKYFKRANSRLILMTTYSYELEVSSSSASSPMGF